MFRKLTQNRKRGIFENFPFEINHLKINSKATNRSFISFHLFSNHETNLLPSFFSKSAFRIQFSKFQLNLFSSLWKDIHTDIIPNFNRHIDSVESESSPRPKAIIGSNISCRSFERAESWNAYMLRLTFEKEIPPWIWRRGFNR